MGMKLSVLVSLLALVAFGFVAFGCGDDDDMAAEHCPADASAGTHVSCHCGDAGVGTATCKADGTMGTCSCAGDAGTAGTGSGGRSGSGGATAGSGAGNGGASGSDSDAGESEDAGADEDAGGTSQQPAPAIPTDGNQFTECTKDRDCNRDLGCYNPESGGFCSAVCDGDEDCVGIKGGTFHCGQSGLCSAACANAQDDASCPGGMKCVAAGGGGGDFRCLYPAETPAPTGMPFASCNGGGGGNGCMDGLECVGGGGGNTGFCSHQCTPSNSNCADVVAPSGTIAATCVPQTTETGNCALNCEAMPAGCPTGMQCVMRGFYMLCEHTN